MKRIFLFVIFVMFYACSVSGMVVSEEEKNCLLQASNLVETDFITVGTSSDLNGRYEVNEDLIYELSYSACGYVPEFNTTFENVMSLDISYLNLTSFDFSMYPNVVGILASDNSFEELDIQDLSSLMILDVENNLIRESEVILDLVENNGLLLNINGNRITDDYYHQLYNLGVDLDYRPTITLFINETRVEDTSSLVYHVATSSDISWDTMYATSVSIQNGTGTDLMYDNNQIVLPFGEYTITVSNDKYSTSMSLSIVYKEPEINEPTSPEEEEIILPPVIEEPEEDPKDNEGQIPEDIEDNEEDEEISKEVEDTIINKDEEVKKEEQIKEVTEEEIVNNEENVEEPIIASKDEDNEEDKEPILEVLPNTYDRNDIFLIIGWLFVVLGLILLIWKDEREIIMKLKLL